MRPLGVYWEDTRHMYNSIIVCITRQSRDTVEQQIGRGHVLELRYCRSKRDWTEGEMLEIKRKKCIQQVVETVSSKFNDIQREKQTITVTHVWIMKRTNLRKAT